MAIPSRSRRFPRAFIRLSNINWKVRFKNGYFLASLAALVIAFVYDMLALLGIAPAMDENALLAAVKAVLTVLSMMGIITGPTTKGVSDSVQAMTYTEPKK